MLASTPESEDGSSAFGRSISPVSATTISAGPSSSASPTLLTPGRRTSAAVVHQDGGMVDLSEQNKGLAPTREEEMHEAPEEIPPTYESIAGAR